jgi:type IV secretory pathway VirB2 component (pilin)
MKKLIALSLALILAASMLLVPAFAAGSMEGPPDAAAESMDGSDGLPGDMEGAAPAGEGETAGPPSGSDGGSGDSAAALEVNTSPLAQGIALVAVIAGGAALIVGIIKGSEKGKKKQPGASR